MQGALALELLALLDDFIWYAWRLLLGACLTSPELFNGSELPSLVMSGLRPSEPRVALPYPSNNVWILEEIATCLTLGRVPGALHETFLPEDVAQGDECFGAPPPRVVAHYFSVGEDRFVASLNGS